MGTKIAFNVNVFATATDLLHNVTDFELRDDYVADSGPRFAFVVDDAWDFQRGLSRARVMAESAGESDVVAVFDVLLDNGSRREDSMGLATVVFWDDVRVVAAEVAAQVASESVAAFALRVGDVIDTRILVEFYNNEFDGDDEVSEADRWAAVERVEFFEDDDGEAMVAVRTAGGEWHLAYGFDVPASEVVARPVPVDFDTCTADERGWMVGMDYANGCYTAAWAFERVAPLALTDETIGSVIASAGGLIREAAVADNLLTLAGVMGKLRHTVQVNSIVDGKAFGQILVWENCSRVAPR